MTIADTPQALRALTSHAHAAVTHAASGGRLDAPEQVATIGGTALGFALASAFAQRTPGVTMPPWTLADPDEVASAQFEDYVHAVCTPGSNGILVKYSSVNESFTAHARRGANSSARAQFRTVGDDTPGLVLNAARRVTATTRAVLLQDLISLRSARGGYLHIYVYGPTAVVEYITAGEARILFAGDGQAELYVESTHGATLKAAQRQAIICQALAFSRFATSALTGDPIANWNIEGCWDPDEETLYIFQSRPSPTDRPADGVLPALDSSPEPVWSTHFVWGAFDITTTLSDLTVRTESDIRTGGPVEPLLPTPLVVATSAAFRLSHEPYFLPSVAARDGYNFVHVPQEVVDQLGSRQVRFHSNGDQCHVVVA